MEEWREIPGYPDYVVSSYGRVCSYRRLVGRFLSPTPIAKPKRHLAVILYDRQGKRRTWLVHRLVLLAFVGPPPFEKARALHKNDIADDNRLENLYWGSDSNNQHDRFRHHGGHTEETRNRISIATTGRTAHNKGKKMVGGSYQ